jgi:hypothetical protein
MGKTLHEVLDSLERALRDRRPMSLYRMRPALDAAALDALGVEPPELRELYGWRGGSFDAGRTPTEFKYVVMPVHLMEVRARLYAGTPLWPFASEGPPVTSVCLDATSGRIVRASDGAMEPVARSLAEWLDVHVLEPFVLGTIWAPKRGPDAVAKDVKRALRALAKRPFSVPSIERATTIIEQIYGEDDDPHAVITLCTAAYDAMASSLDPRVHRSGRSVLSWEKHARAALGETTRAAELARLWKALDAWDGSGGRFFGGALCSSAGREIE